MCRSRSKVRRTRFTPPHAPMLPSLPPFLTSPLSILLSLALYYTKPPPISIYEHIHKTTATVLQIHKATKTKRTETKLETILFLMDHKKITRSPRNSTTTTSKTHRRNHLAERGSRIKVAAELGLARSCGQGRHWGLALRRRLLVATNTPTTSTSPPSCDVAAVGAGVEEEVVVEEKVRLLQRLVPGGEEMEVDRLFEETADYIEALRAQVGVMRALTCILGGGGEKVEKTKVATAMSVDR